MEHKHNHRGNCDKCNYLRKDDSTGERECMGDETKPCPENSFPCYCPDCPACAVEKYRETVLEKIRAKRDEAKENYDSTTYQVQRIAWNAKHFAYCELIKELDAD